MTIITNWENVTIEELEAWMILNVAMEVDGDKGTVYIPMQ